MNLSALKSLQSRVREATGADRDLDWEIAEAFGMLDPCIHTGPAITTYPEGLGACVALMMEVLPGARWAREPIGNFWVFAGGRGENEIRAAPLANDCLTFIDAIIQAEVAKLEATETTHV